MSENTKPVTDESFATDVLKAAADKAVKELDRLEKAAAAPEPRAALAASGAGTRAARAARGRTGQAQGPTNRRGCGGLHLDGGPTDTAERIAGAGAASAAAQGHRAVRRGQAGCFGGTAGGSAAARTQVVAAGRTADTAVHR